MTPIYVALPRRAPLAPTQSSYAFLKRQLRQMHYEQPALLKGLFDPLWRELGKRDALENPRLPQTYAVLSALTKVTPLAYYDATLHRFAPTFYLPQQSVEAIELENISVPLLASQLRRGHFLPEVAAQYCPICLEEHPYHRLSWLPTGTTTCLKHKCLLIDRCSGCSCPLTIESVDQACCTLCNAELTLISPQMIAENNVGLVAQHYLQFLLNIPDTPMLAETKLPPDLTIPVQYRLLDGLQRSIRLRPQAFLPAEVLPEPTGILSVNQRDALYTAAYTTLIDWPESFYQFLDTYSGSEKHFRNSNANFGLGFLYLGWIEKAWSTPEFRFLQDAFDEYITTKFSTLHSLRSTRRVHRNPSLGEAVPYVTFSDAAQQLGIALNSLRKLVDRGVIQDHKAYGGNKRMIHRNEIAIVQQRWEQAVPLQEAAQLLGLSDDTVLALVTSGSLTAERGPLVDDSAQWLISLASINDFCHRVGVHLCQLDDIAGCETVSLDTTARMASVIGFNSASVLEQVANGGLRAFTDPTLSSAEMRNFLFLHGDIPAMIQRIKRQNGWLTRYQVAKLLGVKDMIISRWQHRDLLQVVVSFGSNCYFSEAEVQTFIHDHIFSQQAATILQVGHVVVQHWARNGRLHPISGPTIDNCHRYLFRREEIEALRPEKRLTAPQMARHLGISRSQLGEWIKKGKVKPVSGPTIDGAKHYLFLLND